MLDADTFATKPTRPALDRYLLLATDAATHRDVKTLAEAGRRDRQLVRA